jgi:putative transposase
LARWS